MKTSFGQGVLIFLKVPVTFSPSVCMLCDIVVAGSNERVETKIWFYETS